MSDRLFFRLLGPLVVERGETRLNVGGPKAQALLAMLLLRPGETVPTDALLDAVWGEVAPPTARTALQVQVSKLRKVLASDPSVQLRTRAPGYALEVDLRRLDVARFDESAEEGRAALAAGDAAGASDVLGAALDLWRGAPLEGLAAPGLPTGDLHALEERRVETRRLRAEAELELGRHAEMLPELERLRADDPLDEIVHALLATALYRSGRQSDALSILSTLRRALSDELGISPGPAIDVLERRVLEHDPTLAAPPPAEPAPAEPREWRKVVTALACRIGPEIGGDPEAQRASLHHRVERVRTSVEEHGGSLPDPISGRVTALFGVPRTHEDDVERAARTALELSALDPELRIGLATDEVLVAGEGADQRLRSEGPLDAAEGLAREAAPGEVLAAAETARLLRGRLNLEPSAAGGEAMRVVPGAMPTRSRQDRPLVGRGEQLAVLREALDRVARTRAGSLVTVIGSAGVGKSALLDRFLSDVHGSVAIGRCLPYGHDITYWPVAELIRRLAGIMPEDPPEVVRERISTSTAGQDDGAFVAEQLLAILGLGTAVPVPDDVFWAIRRFLERAADADPPLVVVFDDIHWADATLLDLITYLATWIRDAPVLLICLARPELLESRPAWGGGRLDAANLPLEPLPADDAELLLDRLAGTPLPAAVRRRILEVAEGNPLFLEELAAMLTEEDLFRDGHGQWVRAPDATDVPIPPTVQALMVARLDRLPAGERRLLEQAAVVGKEFAEEDLLAFEDGSSERIRGLVSSLVEADILVRDARLPQERGHRFRHILLRDAVYRATPKATRADDHVRFAIEFELRTQGRLAEFEEILGYHLEAAWRYRRELGLPIDGSLAERAARHLISAGRRAFMRTDNPAATGLLGRARGVLAPDDPQHPDLARLLAVTAFDAGEPDAALTLLGEGLAVARALGDEAMDWRLRVEEADIRAWLSSRAGNAELAELSRAAIEALTRLGDAAGAARAYRLLGDTLNWEGHWSEAVDAFREGQRLALEGGDEREAGERANSSVALGPVPVEQCIQMSEAAVERSGRRNPDGLMALGFVYAMAGREDDARRLSAEALTRVAELGDWREASVRMYSALAFLVIDDAAEAEATIRPAVTALQRMGERNLLSSAAALLAESSYRLGRIDEADEAARLSEEVTSPDDVVAQMAWRALRGKILAARGDLDEAVAIGRTAIEVGAGAEFPMFLGDAHMDLAVVLEAAGRPGEAASEVRAALDLYERKGIVTSTRRAAEDLARLGAT